MNFQPRKAILAQTERDELAPVVNWSRQCSAARQLGLAIEQKFVETGILELSKTLVLSVPLCFPIESLLLPVKCRTFSGLTPPS